MIQFALKCENGHSFDSWFQSASAYDALTASGHVNCVVCGSGDVSKAIMSPRVGSGATQDTPSAPMLQNPRNDVEKAMAELRQKVEKSADYVGEKFADEARAIHLGEKPERSIYGEARLDQARDLIDEGVPLMPLPFRPKQKSN